MRRHRKPNWGCQKPVKEVVYPVKQNMVHCCSEETIKHVHPMHTTVMNHHLVKNEHVYPHTTSYGNTVNEVDITGMGPGSQVAGAMSPGYPGMGPGGQVAGAMSPGYPGMGPGGQVAGAMNPSYPGMGAGGQVAGAMGPGYPGMGPGMTGMHHCKKPTHYK
ncbi:CotD family spore coat protein [Virgibacillus sp. W0430]|uniref:CotD family spore coat protein n=1 Tax=Virgibacillus sp. W0430 TaxID=3391580 RepID=UPI003F45C2EF